MESHLENYKHILDLPNVLHRSLRVSMIVSFLLLIFLPLFADSSPITLASLAANFMLSVYFFDLNRKGKYSWAAVGFVFIICNVLTINALNIDGIYGTPMLGYPLVIVFAAMLFGRKWVWLSTTYVVANLGLIYAFTITGRVQPFEGAVNINGQDVLTNMILLIICGGLLWLVMGIIESNVNRILESETRIQNSYEKMLEGWSRALELRDNETQGHSQRVTDLTLSLAKAIDYPADKMKFLRWGARLHDIGKMGVPDSILLKAGKLTPEEMDVIKEHPAIAIDLLQDIPYLEPALTIPQHHHERWNGSGYPNGLFGKNIPLEARLFAIADVYDALNSDRPYSAAWAKEESLTYLKEMAGVEFDPELVSIFINIMEPISSPQQDISEQSQKTRVQTS